MADSGVPPADDLFKQQPAVTVDVIEVKIRDRFGEAK